MKLKKHGDDGARTINHPEAEKLFNPDNPPSFHDPFAGGGAIPIEAQRLGLDSYGSDLNPFRF